MRIGLIGIDSSHAEDFLRLLNAESRYPGHRVTALCGPDPVRLATLAGASNLATTQNPADLVGTIDTAIIGDRHGGLHRAHALPFIEAGLPVFIDKPLTCSVADAEAILSAARRSGSSIASASAVRWQPDVAALAREIERLGGPLEVTTTGPYDPTSQYGGSFFYGIHAVELALQLAGSEIASVAVEATTNEVSARCRVGTTAVTVRLRRPTAGEDIPFAANVVCAAGRAHRTIGLDADYMSHVLDRFIGMLETGQPPMSAAELLAPVHLMATIDEAIRGRAS